MDPCSFFLHTANTKAENSEWDNRLKHHEMHTTRTYVIYIYKPHHLSNKSRNEYESSIKKGDLQSAWGRHIHQTSNPSSSWNAAKFTFNRWSEKEGKEEEKKKRIRQEEGEEDGFLSLFSLAHERQTFATSGIFLHAGKPTYQFHFAVGYESVWLGHFPCKRTQPMPLKR